MARIIGMLAYGKESAKGEGRSGLIAWDGSHETLYYRHITCTMDEFKRFVHDIVKSASDILYEFLFFGVARSTLDLNSLHDVMTNE